MDSGFTEDPTSLARDNILYIIYFYPAEGAIKMPKLPNVLSKVTCTFFFKGNLREGKEYNLSDNSIPINRYSDSYFYFLTSLYIIL